LGVTATHPRGNTQINGQTLDVWYFNLVGGASILWFGRPRWLTMNLSYDRSYQQLQFRNAGTVVDSLSLLLAFGPFDGFTLSTTLGWSRFDLEIPRLPESANCPASSPGTDENYIPRIVRTMNTLGITVDMQYLYDFRNQGVGLGPFFQGYVYTQLPGDLSVGHEEGDATEYVDDQDCYLPEHYDTVEAVLLLGVRLQWGHGNARPERGLAGGGSSTRGSRDERRLASDRMDDRERRTPGFAYGARPVNADEADERALFGENDRWATCTKVNSATITVRPVPNANKGKEGQKVANLVERRGRKVRILIPGTGLAKNVHRKRGVKGPLRQMRVARELRTNRKEQRKDPFFLRIISEK